MRKDRKGFKEPCWLGVCSIEEGVDARTRHAEAARQGIDTGIRLAFAAASQWAADPLLLHEWKIILPSSPRNWQDVSATKSPLASAYKISSMCLNDWFRES